MTVIWDPIDDPPHWGNVVNVYTETRASYYVNINNYNIHLMVGISVQFKYYLYVCCPLDTMDNIVQSVTYVNNTSLDETVFPSWIHVDQSTQSIVITATKECIGSALYLGMTLKRIYHSLSFVQYVNFGYTVGTLTI